MNIAINPIKISTQVDQILSLRDFCSLTHLSTLKQILSDKNAIIIYENIRSQPSLFPENVKGTFIHYKLSGKQTFKK